MEWTVKPWFNPLHIRERLREIGSKEVLLYYPKPDLSKAVPTVWIPIETQGAIEFLTKFSVEHSKNQLSRRLAYSIRRYLWRSYPELFLSYPLLLSSSLKKITICSISRKPEEKLSLNNIAEIQFKAIKACSSSDNQLDNVHLSSLNDQNEVSYKQSERLSALMLTNDRTIHSKIALLIFKGQNFDPSFVIKLSRTKESSSRLHTESKILKEINEKFKMIDDVPQLILSDHIGISHVNVQTVISGVPLLSVLNKANFQEYAELTTSWLVKLAKNTTTKVPENWREKFIHSVLSNLNSSMGTSLNPDFISQTINLISNLEIPCLVCEHRDFGPHNILVNSSKQLGVIDWETCRIYGIPALDLIHFLTFASILIQDKTKAPSYKDCYHQILDCNTFTGKIYQDCLDYYVSEIGISQSQIPYLRLMTWIVDSYGSGDQKHTLAPQIQKPHINHLALTLWREELSISGIS